MAVGSRYSSTPLIRGGTQYGINKTFLMINAAVRGGSLSCAAYVSTNGDRLDVLAGKYYKDASLWWVIAAASGIGWGMQIPPGTYLKIPNDLNAVQLFV